jgi:hypothetical protein
MKGEIKDHAVLPSSQHLPQALRDPDQWCAHLSVIVVPTAPMTTASGNRAAMCWHAFQPVQCTGTSSDGESRARCDDRLEHGPAEVKPAGDRADLVLTGEPARVSHRGIDAGVTAPGQVVPGGPPRRVAEMSTYAATTTTTAAKPWPS